MTDVLLVQPPIRDFYLTAKRTLPYGLASIAAALARRGLTVEIEDALATRRARPMPLPDELSDLKEFYGRPDVSPFALFHEFRHFGRSFERLGRAAHASGAWLVGISSLFTPYAGEALAAAAAIRRSHPGCRIVLGGHHPTALPESVLESPDVDFVLRGEGEASMPILAERLRTGSSLDDVPGIAFRLPGGGCRVNPPAVVAAGELPLPDHSRIDRRFYRRMGRESTVVVAGRGCPLRCSYCSVGGASALPHRLRPVEDVLSEIAAGVERGVGFVDFEDENLSLDRGWFLDLLRGLAERFGERALELRAMNGLYPPSLDAGVVDAMAHAGFTALNLSLGSTDPTQLRRFHRPDVRLGFDRALALAERHGLAAVGYIVVGAPHQSAAASVDDLLWLAERRVLAGVSVFYPAPGSRDYETCGELGLLPAAFSRMRSTALPIAHTTSRLESATLLRLGRILNFVKHRIDLGRPLPPPSPTAFDRIDPADREGAGEALLAAFLADGRIRGVTRQGEVYLHAAAAPLAARFVAGLQGRCLRGAVSTTGGAPTHEP
jgi:radical SAM superfamily enzyme YgiQ (UPF0313 family)